MKITDAANIQNIEKELIEALTGEIDWQAIESIFRAKHKLNISNDVTYKSGDLVVHNNQVAYKLDFEVKVGLSVLFNRQGEYLALDTQEAMEERDAAAADADRQGAEAAPDQEEALGRASDEAPTADPDMAPMENISKMTARIADMISDINED